MAEAVTGSRQEEKALPGAPSPAARAMRSFKLLFYLAGIGLILFGGAWALLVALAPHLADSPVLRGILGAIGGAAILMVVFICPVAVLAAVIGTLIALVKYRDRDDR
jgi:hypothetical protein